MIHERNTHVVVVAVWAEFIALLVVGHILAERLSAFLAHERHLGRLCQTMILFLGVAFGAIVPLLAAWCSDGDLRVQDVFAGK